MLQSDIDSVKNFVLRKFPLLGVPLSGLEIEMKDDIQTAATDGKTIYFSPSFFDTLKEEEKAFVLAHEVMHVAFNHVLRSKDKNPRLWNLATDAVINQILKNEHLPILSGGVDMPEAVHCSAEEVYEKLCQSQDEQPKVKDNQEHLPDARVDHVGHDDHALWKKAVEQDEKEKRSIKGILKRILTNNAANETDYNRLEKNFEEDNRCERQKRAAQIIRDMKHEKNKMMAEQSEQSDFSFQSVGEAEAAVNWKKMLKKSIEKEHERWSYRRSCADNDYSARVEEMEEEEKSETEVLLDVSGSVDKTLLREFLRQLKPILKQSTLKVGCFDEYFYGFKPVKTNKDINRFKIVSKAGWTENWDLAVKSFTRKRAVNKIVFTDGYPEPGKMPGADTQNINVIWIVYGNKDFNPICGRVIQLDRSQMLTDYVRLHERGHDRSF